MRLCEAKALAAYIQKLNGNHVLGPHFCPKIARWARLRLPNGQVARSRWKESHKPLNKIRVSRNVKVSQIQSSSQLFKYPYLFLFIQVIDSAFTMEKPVSAKYIFTSAVAARARRQLSQSFRFILSPIPLSSRNLTEAMCLVNILATTIWWLSMFSALNP